MILTLCSYISLLSRGFKVAALMPSLHLQLITLGRLGQEMLVF